METNQNIKSLTNQEAFTKAVTSLRKQGKKSEGVNASGSVCLYRLDKTAACEIRCGIGHLIPDELYKPSMEGGSVGNLIDPLNVYFSETISKLFEKCDVKLLERIQKIHDNFSPGEWENQFKLLADEYNLEMPNAE